MGCKMDLMREESFGPVIGIQKVKSDAEAVALMEASFASGSVRPYQDHPYFVLGTIYYEMGDMEQARYWLGEANRISKGRCFRDQPEKYRNVVKK